MIVDTSALLAILLREAETERFESVIETTGEPLLFKGEDFARTDILSALSAEAT